MKCYDSKNNILTLTQWDSNRTLFLKNLQYKGEIVFQFFNEKIGNPIEVIPKVDNFIISCKIPNILLESNRDLIIYVVEIMPDGERSNIETFKIPIAHKKKPIKYIPIEDNKVVELEQLINKAQILIERLEQKELELTEKEVIK